MFDHSLKGITPVAILTYDYLYPAEAGIANEELLIYLYSNKGTQIPQQVEGILVIPIELELLEEIKADPCE